MIKVITICLLVVLCSCANSGRASSGSGLSPWTPHIISYPNHWVSRPQSGNLVVYGMSGRQFTVQEEIDVAHEDAAKKIAMYHGARVAVEGMQNIGSGFLDYDIFSSFSVESEQPWENFIDRLAYDPQRDVTTGEGARIIRFTYPASFPGTIAYSSGLNRDGRPDWIRNRPQNMGNFVVGVGHSARQFIMRDTIEKSYQSAAVAIIAQHSTQVTGIISEDPETHQHTSIVFQRSSGTVRNFTILETWIDPASQDVWTLAVGIPAD